MEEERETSVKTLPPKRLNELTRKLWHISQDDRMIIRLAGEIQDTVNELRVANGLREIR